MGGLAFVFPGQGTQQPGMGKTLYTESPAARALMDQAEQLMPGLVDLCFEGPMERLTQTDIAQPALFMIGLACAAAAKEAGITPTAAAGFSLGEWTACRFAGMLSFEQAFHLVQSRGQWMRQCAEKQPGGMAAVLRMDASVLHTVLLSFPLVYAVNFNAPDQTAVAAATDELDAFLVHMKQAGKRCVKLNVSGAFHSPLMQAATDKLMQALTGAEIAHPSLPVYSNLNAIPYEVDTAADTLAKQASRKVLWVDSIKNMAAAGIDTFLELGPGKVLSGLISKILPEAKVLQAEDMAGIQKAAAQIGGQP